jgi:hypothetical protein
MTPDGTNIYRFGPSTAIVLATLSALFISTGFAVALVLAVYDQLSTRNALNYDTVFWAALMIGILVAEIGVLSMRVVVTDTECYVQGSAKTRRVLKIANIQSITKKRIFQIYVLALIEPIPSPPSDAVTPTFGVIVKSPPNQKSKAITFPILRREQLFIKQIIRSNSQIRLVNFSNLEGYQDPKGIP